MSALCQLRSTNIGGACLRGSFGGWCRSMDHSPPPTFRDVFSLMLWMHWRSFLAQVRGIRRQSPLLLLVLGGFVISYLAIGYWLFRTGLNFLYHFPLVGA